MYETQEKNQTKPCDCHAFCPICGSDLYYQNKECICKNKDCSWTCNLCHKPT